jgi:hypothetical protein
LSLCNTHFRKALHFIRKKCTEPIVTVDNNLVLAVCKFLKLVIENDEGVVNIQHLETYKKSLDKMFIFAFAWGMGS